MFEDARGRKLVVLAHCILNQNAKLDRCAHCQGAVAELVHVLLESGIGILQMECPEMLYLGLDRQADRAANPSVASEDTRIARRMKEPAAQALVNRIAYDTVEQISDYQSNGFSVIGILGINGSPSCGVETTWRDDCEPAGYGELMQAIASQLKLRGVQLPIRGIRSKDVDHAVETVRELVAGLARMTPESRQASGALP